MTVSELGENRYCGDQTRHMQQRAQRKKGAPEEKLGKDGHTEFLAKIIRGRYRYAGGSPSRIDRAKPPG